MDDKMIIDRIDEKIDEDWQFATRVYINENDDIKEHFQIIRTQFKTRYKNRDIEIKEIDEETFLVETNDIMMMFTIIDNKIYQVYY